MRTEKIQPTVDTRDMVVVHTAMRREFGLAPGLVRGVSVADTARSGVVAGHLGWLLDLLHHHHSGEDELLWPLLLARAPEEVWPTIHLMEEQHHGISGSITQVRELLPLWSASASAEHRDQLAATLATVDALLTEHLGLEEREMLPLAAATLSQEEWDRLGEAGMASAPKKDLPLVLGMFMYDGDPEVIRGMLSHAPLLPRLLMPRVAPVVHRRYARRIHGTVSPAAR